MTPPFCYCTVPVATVLGGMEAEEAGVVPELPIPRSAPPEPDLLFPIPTSPSATVGGVMNRGAGILRGEYTRLSVGNHEFSKICVTQDASASATALKESARPRKEDDASRASCLPC